MPPTIFQPVAIGLGSNLGPREAVLSGAVIALASLPQSTLMARASVVRSPPMSPPVSPDDPNAPDQRPYAASTGSEYLNTVVLLSTRLPPDSLLDHLQHIERRFGRDRAAETSRWQPRTLDLDILLYADQRIATPRLTIPHPGLLHRWFYLQPLLEAWPEAVIPGFTGSLASRLAAIRPG